MPRPKQYEDGSVSTGVRLQADVYEALGAAAEERAVSRNLLIDKALRKYLGMKGPRLLGPGPGRIDDVEKPPPPGQRPTRVRPQIIRSGEAYAEQRKRERKR